MLAPARLGQQGNGIYCGVCFCVWRGDQLVSSACLACAASIVIEISVMKKTYDPDSIRVPGFDPEFRVPGLVFVAGFPGSLSESPCTRRGHRMLDHGALAHIPLAHRTRGHARSVGVVSEPVLL